ncbi:hypothetical protein [Nocardia stercoris]|uniref:hypothetical protein n=1 Tax=Nocardia stercoris TaxID=2483361 RepID=UPI0011C3D052|nr:hypothetical protein [Nocardia stercoris]
MTVDEGAHPLFVYYEPVGGGMTVKRWNPGKNWLDVAHEKFARTGILTCRTCRRDLRPNAPERLSAFDIPGQDHSGMRLYCGPCCNDGKDEMHADRRGVWDESGGRRLVESDSGISVLGFESLRLPVSSRHRSSRSEGLCTV